jgi:hypothetical protein
LADSNNNDVYLRQLVVDLGLYCFYVDRDTLAARHHPMDESSDLLASEYSGGKKLCIELVRMQKVYCDAMVRHPVTGVRFYRLQTSGNASPTRPWICDRVVTNAICHGVNSSTVKVVKNKTKTTSGGKGIQEHVTGGEGKSEDRMVLLSDHLVQEGLFAYRAVHGVATRSWPTCTDDSARTSRKVDAGEIVVADLIRDDSANANSTTGSREYGGPFVRLTDGSGWLFVYMNPTPVLEQIPVETGKTWMVAVLNDPVGLKLRQQPVDSQEKVYETKYGFGTVLECDARIVSPDHSGVSFYRVRGTNGWLFDERNGIPMLNLLSEKQDMKCSTNTEKDYAWTPDFVRGVASTVRGLQEMAFDSDLNVLMYDTTRGTSVKVFCTSRTIGVIMPHSSKGTVTIFEHKCTACYLRSVLEKDPEYPLELNKAIVGVNVTGLCGEENEAEEKKDDGALTQSKASAGSGNTLDASTREWTLRKELLTLDMEIESLQARRQDLVAIVKNYDQERAEESANIKKCVSEGARNRQRAKISA